MTIEVANRLLEFRKKSGLSQEELADKLGLSRQSISKWERAEAAPDTDNLIELAKIYNVSLDELINVDIPISSSNESQPKTEKQVNATYPNIVIKENKELDDESDNDIYLLKGGIKVVDDETDAETFYNYDNVYIKNENNERIALPNAYGFGKENVLSYRQKNVIRAVDGAIALISVILYLSLCFLNVQEWSKFWVVIVGFPVVSSIFEAIYTKRIKKFNFALLVTVVYLTLGAYFNLWHPYWFLFIFIAVYYPIIELFTNKKNYIYYEDQLGVEHSIEVSDGEIVVYPK